MSYTKTTWQDGDIITAAKMNNIENGIYKINFGSLRFVPIGFSGSSTLTFGQIMYAIPIADPVEGGPTHYFYNAKVNTGASNNNVSFSLNTPLILGPYPIYQDTVPVWVIEEETFDDNQHYYIQASGDGTANEIVCMWQDGGSQGYKGYILDGNIQIIVTKL